MSKFLTVFMFQLKEGLNTKAFRIMSVILFVLIIGFFAFTHFINKPSHLHILVNNTSSYQLDLNQLNQNNDRATFSEISSSDVNSARETVKVGKKDGLIVISNQGDQPSIVYDYKNSPDYQVIQFVQGALQADYLNQVITQKQVAPDVAQALLTTLSVKTVPLRNLNTTGIVYVFVFLMYLFIILFGQLVAMAIAGEKATRVMEIMITKVKPVVMLYAKVFSSMVMGLIQFAIVLAGYGVARLVGWTSGQLTILGMPIDLSVLNVEVILFFVIEFILGYVLYALIFAALSSIVSRVEDINSVVTPVTLLVVVAMILGMTSLANPNSLAVVIGSYVPFFSPIVTFARVVLGEAGPIEIIITLVELVLTITVVSILATRVYKSGVNRYSGKASFKDAIKLLRDR